MYLTMKNALTVNEQKTTNDSHDQVWTRSQMMKIMSCYFQYSGADRHKLFCGPMFVPALILLPY